MNINANQSFWENPWFVGIVASIISGILVWLITSYIMFMKEKREYWLRISTANNEILYAIQQFIVDKKVLAFEVVDSLINITASKYGVKRKDLNSYSMFLNTIIKHVIENPFLLVENKIDFCNFIIEVQKNYSEYALKLKQTIDTNEEKVVRINSLLIRTIITLGASIATLLTSLSPIAEISKNNFHNLSFMMVIIIGISLFAIILLITLLELKKRRETSSLYRIFDDEAKAKAMIILKNPGDGNMENNKKI